MKLRTSRVRLGRRSAPVRLVAVITAAALLATLLSVNVLANSNKPYTVSGTPASISAGSNNSISITVTDTTKTQQLGSFEIDLSASPGFTFAAVGGSYATVTSTAAGSNPTIGLVNSAMLKVQGLNLQPGESATIVIANVVAPGCTPLQWTFTAQQANQWSSGNGANYLTLAGSQPVSAADPCHLEFSVQPADAGANQTITNTPLTPSGTGVQPVTVRVVDSSGHPAHLVTAVTLSFGPSRVDAAGGSPAIANGGPTNTDPGTGEATFQPSVNVGGAFTLKATSSNSAIAPATSGQFRIWGTATTCDTNACELQLTSTNGQTLNQTSGSTTGAAGASFNIVSFDCQDAKYGGVGAISGTNTVTWTTYNAATTGSKQTRLFIPDALLSNAGILGVHYMVCFSAPYQFPVAWTPASLTTGFDTAQPDTRVSGAMGGTWYTGLVPDCQDVGGYADNAPCVLSRVHANGGLTVTVQSSAGDPFAR